MFHEELIFFGDIMVQCCIVYDLFTSKLLIFKRQKDTTTLEWQPWELMSDEESPCTSSDEGSEDSDVEE